MRNEESVPLILRQAMEIVLDAELRVLPALVREALEAALREDDRWATPASDGWPKTLTREIVPTLMWQERIIAYTRACTLLGRPWPAVLDLLLIANHHTPQLIDLFNSYYTVDQQPVASWQEACQYLRTLRKKLDRQGNIV